MKRIFNVAAAGSLFLLVIFAAAASFAAQEKTAPKPKQEAMEAADESAVSSSLSGKVAETMNAGGYTYVLLDKNGKKTWVAVPQMTVKVGQELVLQPGQEMQNFTSKSLNRTFDRIIFSGGPAAPKGSQAGTGHGAAGNAASGGKAAVAAVDKNLKVEKATGPDAYTVNDMFAKRERNSTRRPPWFGARSSRYPRGSWARTGSTCRTAPVTRKR